MRTLLAALLIGLTTAHAGAAPFKDQNGKLWEMAVPSFEWMARPYAGKIVPHYLPQAELEKVCSTAIGAEPFGCAFPGSLKECHIFVSEDLPRVTRDHVHMHEAAHCVGWSSDHTR